MAIQADGKIIVAGRVQTGTNGFDFAVCRLNSNGTFDTSFGTAGTGKVTVSFDIAGTKNDECTDVLIQPDGKIVMTGTVSFSVDIDFAIVRLTSGGILDTTFGLSTGKRTYALDLGGAKTILPPRPSCRVTARSSSGSYSDTATKHDASLIRVTSDGTLDNTFGTSTPARSISATTPPDAFDKINDVTAERWQDCRRRPDQVFSGADLDYAFARLNSDGSFDNSFNGNGRRSVAIDLGGSKTDIATSVLIQPDGKILASGFSDSGVASIDEYSVVRLNSDGSGDNTFGPGGIRDTYLGFNQLAFGMVLVSDGIVIAGYQDGAMGFDFYIARLVRDQWVVASADQGGPPTVKIFTPTGTLLYRFDACGAAFTGGRAVRRHRRHHRRRRARDFTARGRAARFCQRLQRLHLCVDSLIQVYGNGFNLGVNLTVGDVIGSSAQS